jgi:hypothetical protein
VEPPLLTRRGEAQRITEAFARTFDGKLTTLDGVSPLRQRLLGLCLTGEGGFDWSGLAALKTHVDLREALEIEALKCAAGDARHEYQEWFPKYKDLQRKRRAQGQNAAGTQADDIVDPAVAAAELAMVKQAIQETEAMLTEHRTALLERRPSPFSDADIDGAHAVLESLRANLLACEAAARDDSTATGDDPGGGHF